MTRTQGGAIAHTIKPESGEWIFLNCLFLPSPRILNDIGAVFCADDDTLFKTLNAHVTKHIWEG